MILASKVIILLDTALIVALTTADISAITISVAALLTAIFTGVVNIITALRSERKVDIVSAKADIISGHVNSTASANATKIEMLQKELELMRSIISDKKEAAALLAQSVATYTEKPAGHLESIEKNTKDIVENTAKEAPVVIKNTKSKK